MPAARSLANARGAGSPGTPREKITEPISMPRKTHPRKKQFIDASTGASRVPEGEPGGPRLEGAATERVAGVRTATERMVAASTDPIARDSNPALPGVEFSPIAPETIRARNLSTGWSPANPWLPHMKTELPPVRSAGRLIGRRAGENLRRAADYLGRDTKATWADWKQFLIAHPAQSLVAALAAGFVFARLMSRRGAAIEIDR